ncbi:class I SAM-dependent methyltransferase [Actinorugispora endophytica]|nr:class I SAM-dependent methyltransferase [Actinorugispora endophytica]
MESGVREPVAGDAFGRVLERCRDAGAVPGAAFEVIERDDGYVAAADAVRYFTPAEELSGLDRWACERARGRVLDVGCGAGRHALALRGMGRAVVGLDASPGAVRVARGRGVEAVVGTVQEPPPGLGVFDTVLLLGNNLGLLGGREQARTVLEGLAGLVAPGGRLIGSGFDPRADGTGPGRADADHAAYHAWNRERGRMPGQVRMRVRDGGVATPWFDYLLLSCQELAGIVEPTPWRIEHVETGGRDYTAVLAPDA